jgi:parallel beta-helix repeat protein
MHSSILIELKKFVLLAFVLVLLSIVMSMCVVGLLELQIAYASPYTSIDVDTAYNMITNGSYPDLVILDVRNQSEYDIGHIYGAVWIPHTELDARISELVGHENHEIIVYCRTGVRSVNASNILDSHNFTKVYNMLGGITAWQSNGYSVWTATVHNVNTTFNYDTIQAAIDAPQTLDGHTILVDSGTYYEHVIVNKTVSLIGERKETTIIDGGGYGIVVRIWADGVKISNFTIRNIGPPSPELPPPMDGISAHFSNGEISNNIIEHNGDGIALVFSTNNTITGNKVSENECGIRLDDSSNNTIASNDVSSNKKHGIYLWWDSNNNNLTDNKVLENECGIYLDHSSNNTLTNNEVSNNDYGIHLHHSPENILIGNEVSNNEYGIYLNSSRINSIHHNNFFNNTCQAYAFDSYNSWDDGYPSGGNCWSDYEERYPNATEIDDSGIWDTPYVIDENNQDNYPIVPEFPTWTSVLLLLIVLTLAIAICKRRLPKTPTH